MKRFLKHFACIALCISFIMFPMAVISLAKDTSIAPIRVALVDYNGFFNYNANGNVSGYGYEYLQEISKYTGWKYAYVSATSAEAYEMLANGEIDLMFPSLYSDEKADKYSYPALQSGQNYSVLCVSNLDAHTAYNDFKGFNGMTIGLTKGLSSYENLREFSNTNGFSIKTSVFETHDELLNALENNKIDAVLTTDLEKGSSERTISKFSPEPFYFISSKENTEVISQLNYAQDQIKANNPYYDYELHQKYYGNDENAALIFTAAENEYIKNAKPLITVYDPAWSPIEYFDKKSNSFSGITSDIFNLISANSGLKFQYEKTDSYTDSLNMISNRKADIICGIDNDLNWAKKHNLFLTNSYFRASIVLVKNQKIKSLKNATTALTTDYLAANEYIKQEHPADDYIYLNTPLECFEAVNSGKADITYTNSYVAAAFLSDPSLNNLEISETVNLYDELCIGISDIQNPILLSILNKTINSISDNQLNNIIFKHTLDNEPDVTMEYLLHKNPEYFVAALLLIILITISIFAAVIKTKNAHNKVVEKLAYEDIVTKTSNYNKFKLVAGNLLKNDREIQYAVVYIDIDRFSYINDTFGYAAGDKVLTSVAVSLEHHGINSECSARISSDNFIALFEYQNDAEILERLKVFEKDCNEELKSTGSMLKINFVCSIYKVLTEEDDVPVIVGRAILAHKTIQDAHQGAVVFYDDAIHKKLLSDKNMENAMAEALKNDEFKIYLQPKVSLANNRIVGAETLIRWQHPVEGLLYPDQFIPLFESNGFILDLDFYVYEKMCQLIKKWLDAGKDLVPISVNVPRMHLSNFQFVSLFKALTDKYDIPPELIELELTESIFLNDAKVAMATINYLKVLGYIISIDDFGSGYSSLNLLKDLPIDIIKLDKEFFRKGAMEERDKIVVSGIIAIAHELNLQVVSEGVETEEQVEFLTSVGCDMAQGYYYSKPLTVKAFLELPNPFVL